MRKIKCLGHCVKKGEWFLHPVTLTIVRSELDYDVCPAQYHLDDKGKASYTVKCDEQNKRKNIDIQKFMALPYLNLSIDQMLMMYEIYSIDDLLRWINTKIEKSTPFSYINRIINIWIKSHYDKILKHNKILTKVYLIIYKHYWYKLNIDDDKLEKLIDNFIDNWVEKHNIDDFFFNLGKDLKYYLKKIK